MDWFDDTKPKKGRKPSGAILDRRRKVARLWNQEGAGVRESARQLGCSHQTVANDRRWLLDRWSEIVHADVSEVVGREIKVLTEVEAEAWRAWRKSWEDKEKQRTKREATVIQTLGEDEDDEPEHRPATLVSTTDETEGRIPDSKYLQIILDCQERRAKLLGLYKAVSLDDMAFDFGAMVKSGYEHAVAQRERARAAKAAEDDG